jgi:hypothetical protein
MVQDGSMAVQYRTADGCWSVEVVRLTGTPNKHDGEWLRVRQHGFFVADLRTVEALEDCVSLAELEDVLTGLRLRLSNSNQPSSPPGSCKWTSQKTQTSVRGCLRATSRRCKASTVAGCQWPSR